MIMRAFDEDFADPDGAHRSSGVADPLLAEIERARSGEMRDIVATIQAEQDAVIRAPLERLLIVQGGPGTGKTAVGLHRAALLLYDHREVLERDGVLVVGPNRRFLRYIAQVLPSLGETAVVQATVAALGAVTVTALDAAEVAALKGDERFATVIHRAAWGRLAAPSDDVVARTSWGTVRLTAAELSGLLELCAAEERTVAAGRNRFVAQIHRAAHRQLLDRRAEGAQVSDAIAQHVGSNTELRRAIDRIWPRTSPAALVRRLLTSPRFLAHAARGVLDASEQQAVCRKPGPRGSIEPWTEADVALVDEAAAVLGERPRRYGHVVVDEAQDLSAMALRMLGRRCGRWPSMTVLGDLAQATGPASQRSWHELARHLGSDGEARVSELTIGYRVPGQILDLANSVLPHTATDVAPPSSVRRGTYPPTFHAAGGDVAGVVCRVVAGLAERHATVAVVTPTPAPDVVEALARSGVAVTDAFISGDDHRVLVVPVAEAKGLEFDAVVVVEPALLTSLGPRGARLLFVALTRAVQELAIVHDEPLPESLDAWRHPPRAMMGP
jgi:DNA helicase IV